MKSRKVSIENLKSFGRKIRKILFQGMIRGLTFDAQGVIRASHRPRENRDNDFYSTFDEGETDYKEFVFNARYRVKKLLLEFNAFLRLYDYRNRFIRYSNVETYGFEGRMVAKLTPNIKVFANYYFEDDLEINAPRIEYSQAFWAGFEISWEYLDFGRQAKGGDQ